MKIMKKEVVRDPLVVIELLKQKDSYHELLMLTEKKLSYIGILNLLNI